MFHIERLLMRRTRHRSYMEQEYKKAKSSQAVAKKAEYPNQGFQQLQFSKISQLIISAKIRGVIISARIEVNKF